MLKHASLAFGYWHLGNANKTTTVGFFSYRAFWGFNFVKIGGAASDVFCCLGCVLYLLKISSCRVP